MERHLPTLPYPLRRTMAHPAKSAWLRFHRSHIQPLNDATTVAWASDGLAVGYHLAILSACLGIWLAMPWDSYSPLFKFLDKFAPEPVWGLILMGLARRMLFCIGKVDKPAVCQAALWLFMVWCYFFLNIIAIAWHTTSTPVLFYATYRCLWVYFNVCKPAKCKGDKWRQKPTR